MTHNSPKMSSPRLQTVQAYITAISNFDTPTLTPLLTPTFTYTLAPSTIPVASPMPLATFTSFLAQTHSLIKHYTPAIKTTIDCGDAENKAVVWLTSEAHFRAEGMDDEVSADEWRYVGEYMIVFSFEASGRIAGVLEFVDSKGVEKVMGLMQRAQKNLQAKEEREEVTE